VTPDQWLQLADDTDRKAVQAALAGDATKAATLGLQAEQYRQAAEAAGKLSPDRRRAKPKDGMVNAEKVRHSAAYAADPLVLAANKAHLTLRSLAEKVGVSHTLISKARKGERALAESVAKEIERLTGFAATAEHWPGGIRS
jgi:DNA-binding transcriptional regulator YdaS (Cro superfamily)